MPPVGVVVSDLSPSVGFVCSEAACFLKIMIVDYAVLHTAGVTVIVALAVSLTLIITIIFAKVVGCTLPMFAQKLGLDPAVMASPFITTIVDAIALLTYFRIACLMLPL